MAWKEKHDEKEDTKKKITLLGKVVTIKTVSLGELLKFDDVFFIITR